MYYKLEAAGNEVRGYPQFLGELILEFGAGVTPNSISHLPFPFLLLRGTVLKGSYIVRRLFHGCFCPRDTRHFLNTSSKITIYFFN